MLYMEPTNAPESLIRLPTVLRRVGVGRAKWYQLVADGKAPKPYQLTTRAVAWRESEIQAWIESRPRADDATFREAS